KDGEPTGSLSGRTAWLRPSSREHMHSICVVLRAEPVRQRRLALLERHTLYVLLAYLCGRPGGGIARRVSRRSAAHVGGARRSHVVVCVGTGAPLISSRLSPLIGDTTAWLPPLMPPLCASRCLSCRATPAGPSWP